jgi:Protein of unknown function (DUF998)
LVLTSIAVKQGDFIMPETVSLVPKLFLLCGVIGSLLFLVVLLLEGAVRSGYDPRRFFGSELALGKRGWVQITNFILAGLLIFVSVFGIAQVLPGSLWGTLFLGLFGLSLIVAGAFVTDPVLYFPPEIKERGPTTHGKIHGANFPLSFGSLIMTTLVFSGLFFSTGNLAWALYSLFSGLAVMVFTAMMLGAVARAFQGKAEASVGLWQRAAIATGWIWIAALNAYLLWQVW